MSDQERLQHESLGFVLAARRPEPADPTLGRRLRDTLEVTS